MEPGDGKGSSAICGSLAEVGTLAFSPDDRFVLTGGADGIARFWRSSTGEELCRMISLRDGSWVVVSPDGRFDTNNLEEIKGTTLIMPDDPNRPLPLEILMRTIMSHVSLARILNAERFPDLPSLAELNRVQPQVEKITIIPQADRGSASREGRCLFGIRPVPEERQAGRLRERRPRSAVVPVMDNSSASSLRPLWILQAPT